MLIISVRVNNHSSRLMLEAKHAPCCFGRKLDGKLRSVRAQAIIWYDDGEQGSAFSKHELASVPRRPHAALGGCKGG